MELLEARHRFGPEDAAIQIVMFTDYQCPDCYRIEKQLDDLVAANADISVSVKHFPLERYYTPKEFKELGDIAKAKGFLLVSSSPLTRSSYHADEDFAKLQQNRLNNH